LRHDADQDFDGVKMLDDPRKGTAVAALGGGGVMVILTYVLFLLHVDVPAPVVAAITGVLGSIAGFWVHSTTLQEDRAALHKLILARLGEHVPPAQPLMGKVEYIPVLPSAPQRSAAELLQAGRR
jgi:hypothetical protein